MLAEIQKAAKSRADSGMTAVPAPEVSERSAVEHQVEDQSEVIAFLTSPEAYGLTKGRVERIDTHAALVFLAGARATKIKRAVSYPYLDFSSLEKRHAACLHEVELNRRTAPDLYLGVAAIRRDAHGGLYLETLMQADNPDPVVEWAVSMKRFESGNALDRLAARDALSDRLLTDLARCVADFHARAEVHDKDFVNVTEFAEIIRGNDLAFEEFDSLFPRDRSLGLTRASLSFVEANAGLFDARQKQQKIRQCHGDLHLANIVMIAGKPVLFDAIEFDDRLATVDILYDLAFLLMDLWERGKHHQANVVLNQYLSRTKDFSGLPLLPLFLSVRAAIRAKVCAAQGQAEAARKYFLHAVDFLRQERPQCIAVGGLSGSGKTSLARVLAPSVGTAPGALHLRSDVLRKEIFAVEETERLPQAAYKPEVTERVYAILIERARAVLSCGRSVIVDAVFSKPGERQALEEMAAALRIRPQCFWLTAPVEVLKARVAARRLDASDATPAIVEQQMAYDTGAMGWHCLDSGATPDAVAAQLLALLKAKRETQ